MRFDVADPVYQRLLSEVVRSDGAVVPFAGAGLSVYGSREERLPLWSELLERLIEEGCHLGLIAERDAEGIKEALRARRYTEAMEELLRELGEPTFRRVVEDELDDTGKPIPPAISQLVAIDWSLIVTTNLDRLIARAYQEKHGQPLTAITGYEARRFAEAVGGTVASSETALAQIHGSLDVYESWLLTRGHYLRLLRDPRYIIALQALFLRTLFFVGFGLRDDDFDVLVEMIADIYPEGIGCFYALIPSTRKHDPAFLDLTRKTRLRPIFYDIDENVDPTDPFAGHRAVYECLEHLASQCAAARTGLDFTLKYFPEPDPNIIDRPDKAGQLANRVLGNAGIAQIVGLGGLGKTSLALQFLQDKRAEIASAGYASVFGCSLYRADIGQFIQDMALATLGPGSRPLPEQVDRICEHVGRHRTLLILDGMEVILDEEGALRSPYVLQILEGVLNGQGVILITSRIPAKGKLFEQADLIEVEPFSSQQIGDFLAGWGLDRLGDAAVRRIEEITAGHPLALRVLVGVLHDVSPEEAIATIEDSAVIDLADEVDPLRENRLARIMGSYFHHLGEEEVAFLVCLTVFERPAPFTLINAAFTREYADTEINLPLLGCDLRLTVARLLERRLLTAGFLGELSCHPTVREYFARYAAESGEPLAPIHRYLAIEALQKAPTQPNSFDDAAPVIDACRHAAKCHDWELFDELFRQRLMRDFRSHLSDTLGAWDEVLSLAALGDNSEVPERLEIQPGYYPIKVARCLKHLGRTSESRLKYLTALKQVASSRDPAAAIYVNNFMTLLVWRGELASADWLAELNIRALSWIEEPWRHRWQLEVAFSSIGYLRMLQGDVATAGDLFSRSKQAWQGSLDERPWSSLNDYYGIYHTELSLLVDPNAYDQALAALSALSATADAQEWPESLCRSHIQAATIRADRGMRERDPAEVEKAAHSLEQARQITAGMNVADVAVAYHLARLKVELARLEANPRMKPGGVELEELVDRIAVLTSASGLALATPDLTAARGALSYLQDSQGRAVELYEQALRECRRQGNAWAPRSPRSLVCWLGSRLGLSSTAESTGSDVDLVELVGSPLSPDWMVERLEMLPSPGGR